MLGVEECLDFAPGDSWGEPGEIRSKIEAVEGFDVAKMLPPVLGEYCEDVARRVQCPIDFIAVSLMLGVAGVVGANCAVRPKQKDNWTLVGNLWGLLIARPGQRKSAILSEGTRMLKVIEEESVDRFNEEMAEYEAEMAEYDSRREAAQGKMKAAAKGSGSVSMDAAKTELMELAADIPVKPSPKRLTVNDTTIEKLGDIVAQNRRGVLLVVDEFAGLLNSFKRAGREKDRKDYLEAWNGTESHTVDRMSRQAIIPNWCVSIAGTIQPTVLCEHLREAINGDNDGFIQRFQLAVYPDEVKEFTWVDDYPNAHARERLEVVFRRLDAMKFTEYGATQRNGDRFPYFRFDDAAQKMFSEFWVVLQKSLRDEGHAPVMIEHRSKYDGLVAKLALLFHLIDIAEGRSKGGPIPVAAVTMAVSWVRYLDSHASRIYKLVLGAGLAPAVALAEKVRNKELKDGFTVREIHQKGWSYLTRKDAVTEAVETLVEKNWLRLASPDGARGRPTLRYEINPKVLR